MYGLVIILGLTVLSVPTIADSKYGIGYEERMRRSVKNEIEMSKKEIIQNQIQFYKTLDKTKEEEDLFLEGYSELNCKTTCLEWEGINIDCKMDCWEEEILEE